MLASATRICKVYRFYKLSAFANSIGHPGKNTKDYIFPIPLKWMPTTLYLFGKYLYSNFSLQIAKPLFYLSSSSFISTFFVSGFVAAVNIDVVSWKRAPLLPCYPYQNLLWELFEVISSAKGRYICPLLPSFIAVCGW